MSTDKVQFKWSQVKSIFKCIFKEDLVQYRKEIGLIKDYMKSSARRDFRDWLRFFGEPPFDGLPFQVKDECARRAAHTTRIYLGIIKPRYDKNQERSELYAFHQDNAVFHSTNEGSNQDDGILQNSMTIDGSEGKEKDNAVFHSSRERNNEPLEEGEVDEKGCDESNKTEFLSNINHTLSVNKTSNEADSKIASTTNIDKKRKINEKIQCEKVCDDYLNEKKNFKENNVSLVSGDDNIYLHNDK